MRSSSTAMFSIVVNKITVTAVAGHFSVPTTWHQITQLCPTITHSTHPCKRYNGIRSIVHNIFITFMNLCLYNCYLFFRCQTLPFWSALPATCLENGFLIQPLTRQREESKWDNKNILEYYKAYCHCNNAGFWWKQVIYSWKQQTFTYVVSQLSVDIIANTPICSLVTIVTHNIHIY